MAKPVMINQSKPLTAEDLRTLFDVSYTFTDDIPVKPNSGEVYCYATSDDKTKGWHA